MRLDLPWKRVRKVTAQGHLNQCSLSGHPPTQMSLTFFPNLHIKNKKASKNPFFSCIHRFQHTNYANIEGMPEHRYERMAPVEEKLACYLSRGETSFLEAPYLPSKPHSDTSCLNGKAYAAAGQAVVHCMAVLQAYQADLMKDLDKGQV